MFLNYVHLPQDFCRLLMSNMQTTGKGHFLLRNKIWETPSFQSILNISCSDLKGEISFIRIINSFGWLGLRDRLASAYLYHQEWGHFPDKVSLKNVEDILSFEERVESKTVEGYDRHFLYAFSLKMGLLSVKRKGKKRFSLLEGNHYFLKRETFEVLKTMEKRVISIDWLCLCLSHLVDFLGGDEVREALSSSPNFEKLFRKLTPQQKYSLIGNLLSYGASIGDESPFLFMLSKV